MWQNMKKSEKTPPQSTLVEGGGPKVGTLRTVLNFFNVLMCLFFLSFENTICYMGWLCGKEWGKIEIVTT